MSQILQEFARETIKQVVREASLKERLEGLSAEEVLKGVPVEERVKGLSADEILKALSPESRDALIRKIKESQGSLS